MTHAHRRRRFLDVLDGAGPFHLAERRVNRDELIARDDVREQDRHGLAVLAPGYIQGYERPLPDHLAAFGVEFEDGAAVLLAGIGSGHGGDPRVDGTVRMSGAEPRSGTRASPLRRGAFLLSGRRDEGVLRGAGKLGQEREGHAYARQATAAMWSSAGSPRVRMPEKRSAGRRSLEGRMEPGTALTKASPGTWTVAHPDWMAGIAFRPGRKRDA